MKSKNIEIERGRRGRPRKVYTLDEAPVGVFLRIPNWIRNLVPSDANLSSEISQLIVARYGDSSKQAKIELKEKIRFHETESAKAKVQLDAVERQEAIDEEIRKNGKK